MATKAGLDWKKSYTEAEVRHMSGDDKRRRKNYDTELRTALSNMMASRDILMLCLFEQFKKMNCVCKLVLICGGPVPCDTCRIESVLRKAKEIAP